MNAYLICRIELKSSPDFSAIPAFWMKFRFKGNCSFPSVREEHRKQKRCSQHLKAAPMLVACNRIFHFPDRGKVKNSYATHQQVLFVSEKKKAGNSPTLCVRSSSESIYLRSKTQNKRVPR